MSIQKIKVRGAGLEFTYVRRVNPSSHNYMILCCLLQPFSLIDVASLSTVIDSTINIDTWHFLGCYRICCKTRKYQCTVSASTSKFHLGVGVIGTCYDGMAFCSLAALHADLSARSAGDDWT
jgi:hypothetical protein